VTTREALVIGGGIIGSAIFHALATRGIDAMLVDAASPGHGVTGASGGMVRAYHTDRALNDLAVESLRAYRRFHETVGTSCGFVETGSLYFDRASREDSIAVEINRLRQRGGSFELLRGPDAARAFPALAWSADDLAVFEPHAGHVDPLSAVRGWIAAALARRGALRAHTIVQSLTASQGRVTGALTDAGPIRARCVILAGNTGTEALARTIGVALPLIPRAVQIVTTDGARAAGVPCLFDVTTRTFARPDPSGRLDVGIALDADAPATGSLTLDAAAAARALATLTRRIPALAGARVTGGAHRADCYAPARSGLIGPVAGPRGLLVAAGFGGTGVKVAPAVARRIADACQTALTEVVAHV
jgi:sarcosine oxidase subunit beta